jgi:4'-phosphopantetheinyl transferase
MDAERWPLIESLPPLGPDDVHVWQVGLERDGLDALLTPAELEQANRFLFPHLRRRHVAGRASLRVLLGEYLAMPPAQVGLETTQFGKPRLVGESADGLRFNIAHSDDLALMAFTRGREIGVDVERERPDVDIIDLARRFFAAEEIAALDALPVAEQRSAFYRCWTRKEAYLKALGLGMQVPLNGFAVSIAADQANLLHAVHDPIQHGRWELRGLSPAAEFAAAVAVEGRKWRLFCARRADFL